MNLAVTGADINVLASRLSAVVDDAYEKGVKAERERCREIVIAMGGPDVTELLRQIDSGED